jgi:hypothetical protein
MPIYIPRVGETKPLRRYRLDICTIDFDEVIHAHARLHVKCPFCWIIAAADVRVSFYSRFTGNEKVHDADGKLRSHVPTMQLGRTPVCAVGVAGSHVSTFENCAAGIRAFAVHPGFVDTQFADEPLRRADAQKYLPQFIDRLRAMKRDPSLGTPIALVADLCVFLASGQGDGLSGRYFRVEDDWGELARCADTINRDDLYTLRLRTLQEPGGPPTPPDRPDH